MAGLHHSTGCRPDHMGVRDGIGLFKTLSGLISVEGR